MTEKKTLPEGFIQCPNCNRDNGIVLLDMYTDIDPAIDYDSDLPNVYIVSVLRCLLCGTIFEIARIDVRFGEG